MRLPFEIPTGQRGWTDPISNLTSLSGFDLERDAGGFVKRGCMPGSCLPSFLHESVHHWCFHTQVGMALTLLHLRARRRALLLLKDSPVDTYEIVEDFVRYEIATALLRPLHDGLALFAEFDVTPDPNSKVISSPISNLYYNFTSVTEEELRTNFGASVIELLRWFRLSEDYIERKESLLSQSASSTSGKAYLLGYMTVKNMWMYALLRCSRFLDTELFLMFLRSFFLEDLGLVSVLLEPDIITGEKALWNIRAYFGKRFDEFLDFDFDRHIDQYENEIVQNSEKPEDFYQRKTPSLGTPPDIVKLGESRLEKAKAELREASRDKYESEVRLSDYWTMTQREIMCIGSTPVAVAVPAPGRILVSRNGSDPKALLNAGILDFICSGDVVDGAVVKAGEATMEAYVCQSPNYRVLCVSQGGRVLMTNFLDEVPEEIEKQFAKYRIDREWVDSVHESSSRMLEEIVSEGEVSVIYKLVMGSLDKVVEDCYLAGSFPNTPDPQFDACVNAVRRNGISSCLGERKDLLRTLVQIGLVGSVRGIFKEAIKAFTEMSDSELDRQVYEIERRAKNLGFSLLMINERSIIARF
jgi:hypothetical protein